MSAVTTTSRFARLVRDPALRTDLIGTILGYSIYSEQTNYSSAFHMASTAAAESEPAAPAGPDVETAEPSPELPAIEKDARLPLSIEPALPLAGAGAEGQMPATQDEITLLLSPSGREYAEAASADAEVIRTVAQAKLRAGPNPSRAQGELLALLGNPNTSSTEIKVAFQAFEVEAKANVRFAWSCACLCRGRVLSLIFV